MVEFTRAAKRKPETKKNLKKWLPWILLGIIGCFVLMLIVSTINFFITFTTFRSPKDGIEIIYPRKWSLKAHPAKDVVAAFVSPKETALDTFLENYNFSTYDMSKEPELMSAEAYANKIIDQLRQGFSDLSLDRKESFIIGGQKGYKLIFRATSKVKLMMVLYVFTIEDKGFNILYLGSADKFRKDIGMLDLVALFLKVRY